MAFIPAPATVKIALHFSLFGQQLINTLWFTHLDDSVWAGGDIDNICEALWNWAATDLLPNLDNSLSLNLIDGVDQENASSFYGSYSALPVTGGVGGGGLPANCCITVKFATSYVGRSFRGRNYISGLPEGFVTGNVVNSTWAADIVDAYASMPSYIVLLNALHVVASHYSEGEPRSQALLTPVTDYQIVDLNVDSQRRRLTGRGA